jgi:hypothetical protein
MSKLFDYKLTYGEDFINLLINISSESEVAKTLIPLRGQEVKESLVFINGLHTNPDGIAYYDHKRWLAAEKKENFYLSSSNPYISRPARVVQKIFKLSGDSDRFNGHDYSIFAELYNTAVSDVQLTTKIVTGELIKKYYHYSTYAEDNSGDLAASCMRHDKCQKFFDLYTQHPAYIGMAILLDKHQKLLARCLLWDPTGEGEWEFFDRVYAVDYYHDRVLQLWCIEQGFQNIYNSRKDVSIQLPFKFSDYNYYPYLDSFRYLNNDGLLSTVKTPNCHILEATNGYRDHRIRCNSCGRSIEPDDVVTGEDGHQYCSSCLVYCEYIDKYLPEELVCLTTRGDYVLRTESFLVNLRMPGVNESFIAYREDTTELAPDTFILSEDVVICFYSKEKFHKCQTVVVGDVHIARQYLAKYLKEKNKK